MKTSTLPSRGAAAQRQQRGVVLFVALIVLIVMTLAGLALLRQMTTGVSIAGNIAFKESATSVADRGAEVALQYLALPSTVTQLDSFANGYHSGWLSGVDSADPTNPVLFDWGQSATLVSDHAQTGNTVHLIIHRLCLLANQPINAVGQTCSDAPVAGGGSAGGGGYGSTSPFVVQPRPFYRVTTRVDGPRNTFSYTQVVLQ